MSEVRSGPYDKDHVARLYIFGRLCDVFGFWESSDEPNLGNWLVIDAIRDVETGQCWDQEMLDEHCDYQDASHGTADAIEKECRIMDQQQWELAWPDFDYKRDVLQEWS